MSRKPQTPSKPVSRAYLFRKVANEKVEFETESGLKKMTRWEGLVRMVQQQAQKNNSNAVRLLSRMRQKFPGKPAGSAPYITVFSDNQVGY